MESLDVVELGTGFIRVSFVFGRHDDGLDYIEKKVRCERWYDLGDCETN
jgi:hypothetical protein